MTDHLNTTTATVTSVSVGNELRSASRRVPVDFEVTAQGDGLELTWTSPTALACGSIVRVTIEATPTTTASTDR